ncbi:hypothetical protein OH76DRAFT_1490548 [Lentinus brumalis]|uniref:Uncharacterized protein n=1 Tax=Lentinus brumalis TaxID=2498619 RepID=A0A371CIP2_9APHY|nr:hypothetical protein OH76DRAFT_1490548 [Polyporus brumalis]
MSSNDSEDTLKSMRMWYTAPCELVLAFSDFAHKNAQIFVVAITRPLSLRLCILVDEEDSSTVFSQPLNQAAVNACQIIEPAMINMRISGECGLFLVFPCDMIAQEFLDAVKRWFSMHTLPTGDLLVREESLAPGPLR